jgi:hypothetical protein
MVRWIWFLLLAIPVALALACFVTYFIVAAR